MCFRGQLVDNRESKMAFVKVLKNKAWFKRYQVKNRRRREGKTDYQARRKMVRQDKNKFNTKKYRFIVRFTNKKVICQVAYATIIGDFVVASATSIELEKYGISAGLKNYAAAYATGLLCARRTLKHFNLHETIKGKEEADGEDYHIEEEELDQRPFKCILDVGPRSTTKGHRMWGALKGGVDGGLHIPHNNKKFPGYQEGDGKEEGTYDAEAHKDRILGKHVQEYMEMLQEEDPTKYEAHFSKYIKDGIEPDGIPDLYSEAHSKIREEPDAETAEKKSITFTKEDENMKGSDGTEHVRFKKLTLKQRRDKVQEKIQAAQAKMMEEDD